MSMRKNYRFALEIDGVNHALIQEVSVPTVESAVIAHGSTGNNSDRKTAGKVKVGEMVVKKLKPEGRPDTWAWDWHAKTVGGLYAQYARPAFLLELAPDGVTPIDKFYLGNVWPSKIEHSGYKTSGDGENIVESVTFQVEHYFNTASMEYAALFGGSAAGAGGLAATLGNV